MITLPGGLNVCRDCMQRSFDMMMGSGMDWTKMSGFTPEMLKNMYLDPEKTKDVIGHTGDGEKEEEQTALEIQLILQTMRMRTKPRLWRTRMSLMTMKISKKTAKRWKESRSEIFSGSRSVRSTSEP